MAHNLEKHDFVAFRTEQHVGSGVGFFNAAQPWWAREGIDFADGGNWTRYGTPIDHLAKDATGDDVLAACKLDWTVSKRRLFDADGNEVKSHRGLFRDDVNSNLGVVGKDWHVTQNKVGFDFIVPFLQKGQAHLDSAGSCKGSKLVWLSAKLNESFALFDGRDTHEAFLLFAISHQSGVANHAKLVATRTVCNNSLDINVEGYSRHWFRWDHTKPFSVEEAQERLGIARKAFQDEKALYESFTEVSLSKTADIVSFFKKTYGLTDPKPEDKKAEEKEERNNKIIEALLGSYHTQPGKEFGEGSLWQALNAVTYHVDNVAGRNGQHGFASSQFGNGSGIKHRAKIIAKQFALAA